MNICLCGQPIPEDRTDCGECGASSPKRWTVKKATKDSSGEERLEDTNYILSGGEGHPWRIVTGPMNDKEESA